MMEELLKDYLTDVESKSDARILDFVILKEGISVSYRFNHNELWLESMDTITVWELLIYTFSKIKQ